MLDVLQLKNKVNQMPLESIRATVDELRLEGLVTGSKTPFRRVHFNTCFAEIEALLQRAGYHRQVDVVGYQGQAYALFDPGRWEAVEVLRWLKEYVEEAQRHASEAPVFRTKSVHARAGQAPARCRSTSRPCACQRRPQPSWQRLSH